MSECENIEDRQFKEIMKDYLMKSTNLSENNAETFAHYLWIFSNSESFHQLMECSPRIRRIVGGQPLKFPETNIVKWARRETELAIKEKFVNKMQDRSYWSKCYGSAFRTFQVMMEDGSTENGTFYALQKLNEGMPLTPIMDLPDEWIFIAHEKHYDLYQSTRYASLFKHEHDNRSVTYHDSLRIDVRDIHSATIFSYYGKFISDLVDEFCPITMPYNPKKSGYIVRVETFACGEPVDDPDDISLQADTVAVYDVETPDKNVVDIYRFYKVKVNLDGQGDEATEITFKEYMERCNRSRRVIDDWKKKNQRTKTK